MVDLIRMLKAGTRRLGDGLRHWMRIESADVGAPCSVISEASTAHSIAPHHRLALLFSIDCERRALSTLRCLNRFKMAVNGLADLCHPCHASAKVLGVKS
jgi:hypothetical protein